MKISFTQKILEEKTISIFAASGEDNAGKTLYVVFAVPKKDEKMVTSDNFDIYKQSKILLLGSGDVPENIEGVVKDLLKK